MFPVSCVEKKQPEVFFPATERSDGSIFVALSWCWYFVKPKTAGERNVQNVQTGGFLDRFLSEL